MAQLTDDCFAHGGELLPYAKGLELLHERLDCIAEIEEMPLTACLGRVLAEDLISDISVPQQANSAVDGYAVFFEDLNKDAPTILPVVGRAAAGHPLTTKPERGQAVRIFTGAPLPEGPDTVMMQEDCERDGDFVSIRPGIKRGANAREAGEDIRQGSLILKAGKRLRPQDLGQAAAIGRNSLKLRKRLKVALFSTGDELAAPGQALEPGKIFDSNRFTLIGLLQRLGCEVTDLGILEDRLESLTANLREAALSHDALITSGGVSVGEEDHVKPAVEAAGSLHFWRMAIKPGRPLALGQIGRTPFFGLPGNPAAVAVTFLAVVRPALLQLMGAEEQKPQSLPITADFSHKKKKGRLEWVRVHLAVNDQGERVARKFPREGAGILSSFVESDGLIQLPEDLTKVEPGSKLTYLPFDGLLD